MRGLIVLLFALAAVSCARRAAPEPLVPVQLDTLFTLRAGQEAAVEGTRLQLRFVSVTGDSRCPIDVTCVWAGDARTELVLTCDDGVVEALDLHTFVEPRSADVCGYRVALERLDPVPRSERTITQEQYVAEFRVTRAP